MNQNKCPHKVPCSIKLFVKGCPAWDNDFQVSRYKEYLATTTTGETNKSSQVGGTHYGDQATDVYAWSLKREHDCLQHSAIKYIDRHKKKNGAVDIKKAISVCHRILEEHYPDEA